LREVGNGAAERVPPVRAVFDEPIFEGNARVQFLDPGEELHELQGIEAESVGQ